MAIGEVAEGAVQGVHAAGEAAGVHDEVAQDARYPARPHLTRERRQRLVGAVVEELAPGGIGARLDDEVSVENAVRHCCVGRQAGAPAVLGAEVIEGRGHRDRLQHRRGHEEAAGVELVDDPELAAVQQPRGEVAPVRPVGGRARRLGRGVRGRVQRGEDCRTEQ